MLLFAGATVFGCVQPPRSVPQVAIADDVLPVEHAAPLAAAQFHGHSLRHAGSDHVSDGRASKVVTCATVTTGRINSEERQDRQVLPRATSRPLRVSVA